MRWLRQNSVTRVVVVQLRFRCYAVYCVYYVTTERYDIYPLLACATDDNALQKDEASNEYVAWSQPRDGTDLPSSLAYNGAVDTLRETGILNRFDAKTGKHTYKTRTDPTATAFTTSPWAYNGKLFC